MRGRYGAAPQCICPAPDVLSAGKRHPALPGQTGSASAIPRYGRPAVATLCRRSIRLLTVWVPVLVAQTFPADFGLLEPCTGRTATVDGDFGNVIYCRMLVTYPVCPGVLGKGGMPTVATR